MFFITEARKGTGFEHAHVAKELKMLADLEMLVPLPVNHKNDRQYYQVNAGSPLWRFVDVALHMEEIGEIDTGVLKHNT